MRHVGWGKRRVPFVSARLDEENPKQRWSKKTSSRQAGSMFFLNNDVPFNSESLASAVQELEQISMSMPGRHLPHRGPAKPWSYSVLLPSTRRPGWLGEVEPAHHPHQALDRLASGRSGGCEHADSGSGFGTPIDIQR